MKWYLVESAHEGLAPIFGSLFILHSAVMFFFLLFYAPRAPPAGGAFHHRNLFSAVLYAIDGHWPAFYRAKLHLYRRCVAPQLATDEANEVFCRPLERFVATLVCVWLADQCRAVRCRCLPCVHRHSPAVTPSLLAARQVSLEQIKRLGWQKKIVELFQRAIRLLRIARVV